MTIKSRQFIIHCLHYIDAKRGKFHKVGTKKSGKQMGYMALKKPGLRRIVSYLTEPGLSTLWSFIQVVYSYSATWKMIFCFSR